MLPNVLAVHAYTSEKILSLSLSLFSFKINIFSEKKMDIYVHLDDDVFPNCIINKGILKVEILFDHKKHVLGKEVFFLIWLLGFVTFFF